MFGLSDLFMSAVIYVIVTARSNATRTGQGVELQHPDTCSAVECYLVK